jgi:hypothetical protein
MADKKISQLTGASTPLAGTEVLPVVQSGSTVKVSAADLTAGRAVGALSFTSTAAGNDTAQLLGTGLTVTHTGGRTSFATFNQFPGWNGTLVISSSATEFGINSSLPFAIRDGSAVARLSVAVSTGNTTVNTGNLIIGTAAKGIDFSANTGAAGETSSLLNWYEEGSYTATLTSAGGSITVSTSFDTLGYTRIGRMVYVHGYITASAINSPTGELRLNVPFNTCTSAQVGERGSWGIGGISIAGSASSVANGFQIAWSDNKSYVTIHLATGSTLADASAQIQGSSNTDIRIGFWYPCSA